MMRFNLSFLQSFLLLFLLLLLSSELFLSSLSEYNREKQSEDSHHHDHDHDQAHHSSRVVQSNQQQAEHSNKKKGDFRSINASDPSFSISVSVPAALTVAPPLQPLNSSNNGGLQQQDYSVFSSSGIASAETPHQPKEKEEYDYVIVGGGSSGSIVAGRLSTAGYNVILLEAGGPTQWSLWGRQLEYYPNLTLFDIPLYWTDITSNPSFAASYEWPLNADPHPQVARGLGGCSVHNAMIYIRGLDRDFDMGGWGSEWSYDRVLPFYMKSVNQRNPQLRSSNLHGKDGPIYLTSLHKNDIDPIAPQFLESCSKSGMTILEDFNGQHRREGAGYYQFLIRDGQRETPASAWYGHKEQASEEKGDYIASIGSGKLTVRTYAEVSRVIFDVTEAMEKEAAEDRELRKESPDRRKKNKRHRGRKNPSNESSHSASAYHSVWSQSTIPPRAIGVDYVDVKPNQGPSSHQRQHLPHPRRVYAKKEVVLSAGAIHSPKLLLLSGIGSRTDLEKFDIYVISDLAGVGRNCMDGSKLIMQWDAPSIFFSPCIPWEETGGRGKEKTRQEREKEKSYCDQALQSYYNGKAKLSKLHKAYQRLQEENSNDEENSDFPADLGSSVSYGIMGSPGFSAGAFLKSHPVLERPNIQLTIFPWDKIQREWKEKHTGIVTMEIATNNPISRGRVSLHSADPLDPPIVQVNYLSDSNDIEVLLWAIHTVRKTVTFPPLNTTLIKELLPGSDLTEAELRDYILCGAKEYRINGECERQQRVVGHLGGTVKMGNPYSDAYACVDSHLRVIGVEGLRVVDASIMPQLPSGNTHATCMMIGERGADFILQNARGVETTVQDQAKKWETESEDGNGDRDEINIANKNGFSYWVIALVLFLLILLAFAGIYFWNSIVSVHWSRFVPHLITSTIREDEQSRPLLSNSSNNNLTQNQRSATSAINVT